MMRQQNSNNTNRRPRGRSNTTSRKPQQSRNGVFDSNGPGGRIRGNASQVKEKYQQMARDATVAGDRVAAESYNQFAEHYFRVLNESTDPQSAQRNTQPENSERNTQSENSQRNTQSENSQRNTQSENYRHKNARSDSDIARSEGERKPVVGTESEGQRTPADPVVSQEVSSRSEAEDRRPAPRNRTRTRRPRYEASDAPVNSSASDTVSPEAQPEIKVAPPAPIEVQPVVKAEPPESKVVKPKRKAVASEEKVAVVELPLDSEAAAAEKPKRRTRTPKAASAETKTPRPRGRPRKTAVAKDTTPETA